MKKIRVYLGVFFVVSIFGFIVYSSFFKIVDIRIDDAKHTDIVAVQNSVMSFVKGYRYLIIPNTNIFIYQKNKIRDFVLKNYPSVEFVDIHVDRNKNLVLNIKDRKPLGVWCDAECYFYDGTGVVFKKSFSYTGSLFTAWERFPKVTVNMLDTLTCEGLCTDIVFIDFLKKYGIQKAIMYDEMLELVSVDGYTIKSGFNASATMSHIGKIGDKNLDFLRTLEYVDVRLPNKIFYKEKGI